MCVCVWMDVCVCGWMCVDVCVLWAALLAVEDNGFGQLTNKDMTSSLCIETSLLLFSVLSCSLPVTHCYLSLFFLFK